MDALEIRITAFAISSAIHAFYLDGLLGNASALHGSLLSAALRSIRFVCMPQDLHERACSNRLGIVGIDPADDLDRSILKCAPLPIGHPFSSYVHARLFLEKRVSCPSPRLGRSRASRLVL